MGSAAAAIRDKIERGPGDALWTMRDFSALPTPAVAKTLSRLASEKVVSRVRKGVYYRPKVTRFGTTKPDATQVLTAILDGRRVSWKPGGLAGWNALGFTSQVPAVTTIDIERPLRIKLPGRSVRLRVTPTVSSVSAEERAALDALRDLRAVPDTTPAAVIRRVVDLCREGRLNFSSMTRAARREPPRVRALMGLIGTLLGEDTEMLIKLRGSLNSTTSFKLGLAEDFPQAADWGIR